MNKIFKILQISLVALSMMLVLVSTLTVNVSAQTQSYQACNAVIKKKITFTSLFNLGNFLPLIPEDCGISKDSNGVDGVNPLPFYYIFDFIVRGAGFLFSLAFYMLPIAVIVYGSRVLFVPFDPSLNKSDFTQASTIGRTITNELGQFLTGIVIILFSYTVVFTILGTLQIDSNTDLSQFFNIVN